MKINFTRHQNVEELELAVFSDLGKLKHFKDITATVREKFKNLFNPSGHYWTDFNLLGVVKVIDDNLICSDSENNFYLLKENPLRAKVKDCILMDSKDFGKIEPKLLNIKVLDKFRDRLTAKNFIKNISGDDDYYPRDLCKIELDEFMAHINLIITVKDIESAVKNVRREVIKDVNSKRAELKLEREAKKLSDSSNYAVGEWSKESAGQFSGFEIKKNKAIAEKEMFVLTQHKKFSDFYDPEGLETYVDLKELESDFLKRHISYQYFKNNKSVYGVSFEWVGDKLRIRINGNRIKCRNPKIVINKILGGASEEQLKIINSLSGIKLKVTELEYLMFTQNKLELELPINFIPVSKNRFKVLFIKKAREFDWIEIKDMFLIGISSIKDLTDYDLPITAQNLFTVTKTMNIKKQEVFDFIKQIAMLKSLEHE